MTVTGRQNYGQLAFFYVAIGRVKTRRVDSPSIPHASPASAAEQLNMSKDVEINSNICHGKPVIAGTRVPVAIIVGSLAGGMSFEDVRREYLNFGGLTEIQIRAALKFAGELVEQESFHSISAN